MNEVTVNMDNLTTEEREQLLALVKKANKKPFEIAKPKNNTDGLVLCGDGRITSYCDSIAYYDRGLWAKTIEELEFIDRQRIILTQYKRLAAESWAGEVIDWNNSLQYKFSLGKNEDYLNIDTNQKYRSQGKVYFKTEEDVKSAIKTIGKENIIKYLFN